MQYAGHIRLKTLRLSLIKSQTSKWRLWQAQIIPKLVRFVWLCMVIHHGP